MDTMYKARALAEDIKSEIELRRLGTAVLSFDTDGAALLQVTGSASDAALVRIATVPTTARDALGLQHGAFTPHVIQLAARSGANANSLAFQTVLTAVAVLRGTRVDVFATTLAPVVADLVPANRLVTFHPSVQFPLTGEM